MNLKNLFLSFFILAVSLSLTSVVNAQKKKVTTTKKTSVGAKGSLSVEAGLIYKSGDVKPVARVEFYLLDDDLENILKEAGVKDSTLSGIPRVKNFAFLHSLNRSYGVDRKIEGEDAIKQHIVAQMTTDFSGKGEFQNVKTGKYYLMGIGGTGKQVVLWNLPIDIKSGSQSITLDNKNAAAIF